MLFGKKPKEILESNGPYVAIAQDIQGRVDQMVARSDVDPAEAVDIAFRDAEESAMLTAAEEIVRGMPTRDLLTLLAARVGDDTINEMLQIRASAEARMFRMNETAQTMGHISLLDMAPGDKITVFSAKQLTDSKRNTFDMNEETGLIRVASEEEGVPLFRVTQHGYTSQLIKSQGLLVFRDPVPTSKPMYDPGTLVQAGIASESQRHLPMEPIVSLGGSLALRAMGEDTFAQTEAISSIKVNDEIMLRERR